MKHDKRSLGRRMAAQRRALFLTQEALAERIRQHGTPCTQSAVARWERGHCVPALRNRPAIAAALVMAPHILFAEDEIDEPDGEAA